MITLHLLITNYECFTTQYDGTKWIEHKYFNPCRDDRKTPVKIWWETCHIQSCEKLIMDHNKLLGFKNTH